MPRPKPKVRLQKWILRAFGDDDGLELREVMGRLERIPVKKGRGRTQPLADSPSMPTDREVASCMSHTMRFAFDWTEARYWKPSKRVIECPRCRGKKRINCHECGTEVECWYCQGKGKAKTRHWRQELIDHPTLKVYPEEE